MNWLQKIAEQLQILPSECVGYHNGQTDCRIKAYLNDRVVGYLSYAEFGGQTFIQHIEVAEDMRRQGIATQLYRQLENDASGEIQHTMTTDEGSAWKDSLGL